MSKESKKAAKSTASPAPVSDASKVESRAAEFRRLYMSTPEKAKKTLQEVGILNRSGKLAKEYR